MSRVLVTGGSGRIGRVLVAALRDAGHDVQAPSSADLDLRSAEQVSRAMDALAPESIVHFAGIVSGQRGDFSFNVHSTELLLTAAERSGVGSFVLASSAAVYGDERPHPLSEAEEPRPGSDYARSKWEAEIVATRSSISTVALRIFNVYGATLADSLVARLVASTPAAPVDLRDLDAFVRDYVAVDDVAALVTAVCGIRLVDEHIVINVGSGIARSNRRLVEELSTRYALHFREVGGPPSVSVADIERARSLLAYSPSIELKGYQG